jgi:transmembrane protein TMEM174 (potassium channel)
MQPRDDQPPRLPRPWGRVSTIRLETFSDGVFAIAVTLLALQLHPPDLGGASTAGAVLHALGQELRPFAFNVLAFLVTGGCGASTISSSTRWRPTVSACHASTCGSCSPSRCCPTG